MSDIAKAFVKAKRAFRPALKEKANPAFKGSKYADLASCIEAVDDALVENGIAMYQETFEDQTGVTVETVFLHESGESIRCGKLHVPASKMDAQGFGSALTYARRYSLMAACGMAPEDDDGNAASKKPAPTEKLAWDGGKYLKQIIDSAEACQTIEALELLKKAAQMMCEEQNDEPTYRAILAHYKTRKAQLLPKNQE